MDSSTPKFTVVDNSCKDSNGNAKKLTYSFYGNSYAPWIFNVSKTELKIGATELKKVDYEFTNLNTDTDLGEKDVHLTSKVICDKVMSIVSFNNEHVVSAYSYLLEDYSYIEGSLNLEKPLRALSAMSDGFDYHQHQKTYDDTGLCGFRYNDVDYYYHKNMQGDIVGIYDGASNLQATYSYSTWGATSISNKNSLNIGDVNPIRYRGYYWDSDIFNVSQKL